MASIGRQIVFIEGRGGNTPASHKIDETLKQCFKGLKNNGAPFFPFNGRKAYRAVVQSCRRKDRQLDVLTQSPFAYYTIMTNNETAVANNIYVT